jgi:DNA processing protein
MKIAYKQELIYWIWLSEIKGIGAVISKTLLNVFKTPKNIYNASKEEIINLHSIGNATAELILNSKSLKNAEDILNKCEKLNIKILTYEDCLYPFEVKTIKKSPIILYYRGKFIENSLGVSIVGARRCTEYGKMVTVEAAGFLARHNIPVISGMAKGIDGYAHTACLKNNGYTIAILGCGVDVCYPKEHRELMEKIIENGAVISQYPPETKPESTHFPDRNRLISAWCKKLLVVEAGEKSGSLITAKFAKEQNRQVFAVPNSIYSNESIGTNKLIEEGSKIYLKPSQLLLENYRKQTLNENNSKHTNLTPLEKIIIDKIKDKSITLDELVMVLQQHKSNILETVSVMELEGKIINIGGVLKSCC